MAWPIDCEHCGRVSIAPNIVELINHYLDDQGRIVCGHCRKPGYIEKTFELQEEDAPPWKPYLRAIIRPADYVNAPTSTYQPFAFLVSSAQDKDPEDVWFCYYKDTRAQGGRLMMGHGPGGPPVFTGEEALDLVAQMVKRGYLDADKAVNAVRAANLSSRNEGVMTNSKTADSIDVSDIGGLYWLHLYDHNCIVESGALMIEVGEEGEISGEWRLGWDNGKGVHGKYDENTGSTVLDFGYSDSSYSLWGPVSELLNPGPNERKLAIAGHWSYSPFGGPAQWGAFYAQQMESTAQQMKAFQ